MYILFFVFFYKVSLLKKFFFIITFVLISFLIVMNSSYLKHKFYNQIYLKILDTNKNSNNVKQIVEQNLHLRHYYVASKIFKDNLVFGSGFKTFRIESHKQKYKRCLWFVNTSSSNSF